MKTVILPLAACCVSYATTVYTNVTDWHAALAPVHGAVTLDEQFGDGFEISNTLAGDKWLFGNQGNQDPLEFISAGNLNPLTFNEGNIDVSGGLLRDCIGPNACGNTGPILDYTKMLYHQMVGFAATWNITQTDPSEQNFFNLLTNGQPTFSGFAGVVFDSPQDEQDFSVAMGETQYTMSNLEIATDPPGAAAPEPLTYALTALGLMTLGLSRKRLSR